MNASCSPPPREAPACGKKARCYSVTQHVHVRRVADFTRQLAELWTDTEYAAFQQFLAANRECGDVIPGLGGLRKVRWAAKGRGKRGGARVIYLLLVQPGIIYLFHAYTKGDATDLDPAQKKRLRAEVEEIKTQFQP